LLEFVKTVDFF